MPAEEAKPPDAPSDAATERLEVLVAQCLDLLETDGEDGVERLLRRCPGEADLVRQRLRRLRAAGLLGARAPADEFPEVLGEYRLVRRLGGGGMGVVYLADQENPAR